MSAPLERPPINMLDALLGFRGRVSRGRYFAGMAIVSMTLLAALASFATAMNPTGGGSAFLAIPLFFVSVWMMIALSVQRFRDSGRSPNLVWVQIALLVFLIYPGLEFAETLWPILLAGILFALAFPALARSTGVGASDHADVAQTDV